MIRSCLVRASFYPRLLKGFEPSVSSLTKYTQQFNTKFYTTAAIGVQKFLGDGGLLVPTLPTSTQQPSREYAARRGTRAKRDKLKVKKVVEKKSFQTKRLRKLESMPYEKQRPFDDSHYVVCDDDVYFLKRFKSKLYSFEEALQNLRETHHPTVYNVPNAPVYARVNLDLKYPNRATKCMDGWRSVVEMKEPFLLEGMSQPTVLAFCIEDSEYIANVEQEGGADLAGGKELIKSIQLGDVNTDNFEYIVAHPAIVPELTAIRGLIKRKFPNVRTRTISPDLVTETKRLKAGIKVHAIKNDREPDFAYIETPIGTLDMNGLFENFKSVLKDTVPRRAAGKTPEEFVIGCVLRTPKHGFEEFKIDISSLLQDIVQEKLAEKEKFDEAND